MGTWDGTLTAAGPLILPSIMSLTYFMPLVPKNYKPGLYHSSFPYKLPLIFLNPCPSSSLSLSSFLYSFFSFFSPTPLYPPLLATSSLLFLLRPVALCVPACTPQLHPAGTPHSAELMVPLSVCILQSFFALHALTYTHTGHLSLQGQ